MGVEQRDPVTNTPDTSSAPTQLVSTQPAPTQPVSTQLVRRLARLTFVAVIAVVVIAAVAFRVTGGRYLDVQTPSMAQAAPVGTLLLIAPRDTRHLAVGDIIAFHPPTSPHQTYAHRIVTIDADQTIHTRGDNNPLDDPWKIHQNDLIGVVITRLWGIGWLLRILPFLVLGTAAMFTITSLTRFVPIDRRTPTRILGYSLVTAIAVYIYKPLVRVVPITQTSASGTASTTLVPTGLFGVTVHAQHGTTIHLAPGQIGTVTSTSTATNDHFHISLAPHLAPYAWTLVALACLTPLAISIILGTRTPQPPHPRPLDDEWCGRETVDADPSTA